MSLRGAMVLSVVSVLGCSRDNPLYDVGADEGAGTNASASGSSMSPSVGSNSADSTSNGATTNGDSEGEAETVDSDAETGTGTGPQDPPPMIGPFGEPMLLGVLSDPMSNDDDPTLTADMREIYFGTTRDGGAFDIWFSTRDSVDDPWPPPMRSDRLSSPQRDNTPEVSADGLLMLLASDRDDNGNEDIYMSTRESRGDQWSMPIRALDLSSPGEDVCPFVAFGGEQVYGCNGPDEDKQIVRFDRLGPNAWEGPFEPMNLNTMGIDCAAWLDSSQRVIVFASNREDTEGFLDIWTATRGSPEEPFGDAVQVESLNSPDLEDDPWLSPDASVVYLSSTRPSDGFMNLYIAERER